MAWLFLIIAGLFEIAWAIGLKYTDGFTKLGPTAFTLVAMVISFALLGVSLKTLPVGTAYGIWVGIGTVGTVIFGIILLGEGASAMRLVFVLFIIVGIVGLKLTSPG